MCDEYQDRELNDMIDHVETCKLLNPEKAIHGYKLALAHIRDVSHMKALEKCRYENALNERNKQ